MLLKREQIEDFCNHDWIRTADSLETADLCETALFYMDISRKLGRAVERFTAGTGVADETGKLLACVRK